MRRFAFSLAIAAGLITPLLRAQNAAPTTQAAAKRCPSTASLEDLTKALDDAISGPADKDRTCLRDLFLPEARLSPIRKATDGTFAPRMLTVEDWINAVANRGGAVLVERQVKVLPEIYGHFAHLWSTYELRITPGEQASVTGINSIQAVNDGTRWKVLSVLWEPDTTAGPVPEKYKP
jgi:hypothetical protein